MIFWHGIAASKPHLGVTFANLWEILDVCGVQMGPNTGLNMALGLHTQNLAPGHDEVIDKDNIQRPQQVVQAAGAVQVGLARLRYSAWVVVRDQDSVTAQIEGVGDNGAQRKGDLARRIVRRNPPRNDVSSTSDMNGSK